MHARTPQGELGIGTHRDNRAAAKISYRTGLKLYETVMLDQSSVASSVMPLVSTSDGG